jgi:hypothetical protein
VTHLSLSLSLSLSGSREEAERVEAKRIAAEKRRKERHEQKAAHEKEVAAASDAAALAKKPRASSSSSKALLPSPHAAPATVEVHSDDDDESPPPADGGSAIANGIQPARWTKKLDREVTRLFKQYEVRNRVTRGLRSVRLRSHRVSSLQQSHNVFYMISGLLKSDRSAEQCAARLLDLGVRRRVFGRLRVCE